MPFEFKCGGCGAIVQSTESLDSTSVRCSHCGLVNQLGGGSASGASETNPFRDQQPTSYSQGGQDSSNPYASPRMGSYDTTSSSSTVRGYESTDEIDPRPVDFGQIWEHAFQIWQGNLGLLIGTTLVTIILSGGISFILGAATGSDGNPGRGDPVAAIFVQLIEKAVEAYFGCGMAFIALNLARGREAVFGDLFAGAGRVIPLLLGQLCFVIIISGGILLLIVPGIIAMLALWPYHFVIVERKASFFGSFSLSASITKGNWGTSFITGLVCIGVILVGFMALCVGVIAAIPLANLLAATAYLMMSGQLRPISETRYAQPTPFGS